MIHGRRVFYEYMLCYGNPVSGLLSPPKQMLECQSPRMRENWKRKWPESFRVLFPKALALKGRRLEADKSILDKTCRKKDLP